MMRLLEFASVSFPSEIPRVNSLNHKIHMVGRHMREMGILSLVMSSFVDNHIGGELNIRDVLRWCLCSWFLSWLFSRLSQGLRSTLLSSSIMFSDFGIFNRSFLGSGLLDAIALGLFCSKTLGRVLAHGSGGASVLNETYHSAIALRIEGSVWPSRKLIILLILFRISNEGTYSIISKVGKESLPIIKLNLKCLIINGWPLSLDRWSTNLCISQILIFQIDFDGIALVKLEFSVSANDL